MKQMFYFIRWEYYWSLLLSWLWLLHCSLDSLNGSSIGFQAPMIDYLFKQPLCKIRSKWSTDSGTKWSGLPDETAHLIPVQTGQIHQFKVLNIDMEQFNQKSDSKLEQIFSSNDQPDLPPKLQSIYDFFPYMENE